MKFPKTILATVAGATITVIPALAQDVKVSPPVVSPRPMVAQTLMLSDLLNWEIFLQNNDSAGVITDFVIGPQGNVLYAIGTVNGQNYVIPYSAMTINANDQSVQLAATHQQFERMKFFSGRNFPDFNSPAFRRDMTQVFGDRVLDIGTTPRGRGNLGANQTEGRDTLNPAGKAPPGLNRNRDPNRNEQNQDLDDSDLDDLPMDRNRNTRDLPRGTEKKGTGTTPAEINRDRNNLAPNDPNRRDIQKPIDRTPSGANRVPPRTPGNAPLPNKPSSTPNTPLPKPGGTAPGVTPPVTPPAPGK